MQRVAQRKTFSRSLRARLRNHGYATLGKLIAVTQLFETKDEGTSTVATRDKRHARGAAPLGGCGTV